MASFKDICFTPAEFSKITKIDKAYISTLENNGWLKTTKVRVGNVDRKMIPLEGIQQFYKTTRSNFGRHGDPLHLKKPKNKIQMFYNVKGGTGKSTLTAQCVMQAAIMGYDILAIDLDGQGHLTLNLDVLNAHDLPTIYDVLINDLPIEQAIINVAPGLDLIPANLGLCNIEIPLNMKPRREYRLAEAIKKIIDRYDLVIADTNPAASILNGSMLVATELVNVVCATNPLSFHGMSLVMSTIEDMKKEFMKDLQVKIIPNMYDNREVISQEVLGELHNQFQEECSQTVINRCADLNEATKRRTTVWDVNSKGNGVNDMIHLTEELLYT